MSNGAQNSPTTASPKLKTAEEELKEALRRRDVQQMIESAGSWMSDAMNAWSDDDFAKVAVLAPLAVEHLGKAVLWQKNPVLVVPLTADAEASLVKLATTPSISDPKLRTVGLKLLLTRLEAVVGTLPLPASRRTRMVEIRNGAMHVGASAETSRHILIDALTVCNLLLNHLKHDPDIFYGDHNFNVKELIAQGRSEVQHRVAAKFAHARRHLTLLEERLGETVFQIATEQLEDEMTYADNKGEWGVPWACPECGSHGRLTGSIDLSEEDDPFFDPEDPHNSPYTGVWEVTLHPDGFSCNVCRLSLGGRDELAAGRLPSSTIGVDPDDLGPDFNPEREAQRLYGVRD
ncbi:hypothetical protein ACWIGW_44025 [Nocardia brasiliensis]|uniref:hypothetical protein n=1 Tax=Streptomyces sp. NPDC056056 TaxID=3345698 RepID=UPI0035E36BAB